MKKLAKVREVWAEGMGKNVQKNKLNLLQIIETEIRFIFICVENT